MPSSQPSPRAQRPPRAAGSTRWQAGPVVKRLADRVRAQSPVTTPISLRGDDVEEARARRMLDIVLRIGEAMVSTGTSAADVVETLLRLTHAHGLRGVHIDITFTSITVSLHRGIYEDPLTVMRVVKVRATDYSRSQSLHELVERMVSGQVDLDEARAELEQILTAPRPYSRPIVTGALAMLGGSVAVLFGAGWFIAAMAAVAAVTIDAVQAGLGRRGVAPFFTQAAGAAIPALMAVGVHMAVQAGWGVPGDHRVSLIIASGIVVLLAGFGVAGAAEDALDGYYITAGARTFEVVVLTSGIIVGISAVMELAQALDVGLTVSNQPFLAKDRFLQLIAACFIALSAAVMFHASYRASLWAFALGGLAWAAYLAAGELGLAGAAQVAAATTVGSVLSHLIARWQRLPPLVLASVSLVAFLPGGLVYRGLFQMIEGNPGAYLWGIRDLLSAASTGLAVAGGVALGAYIAAPRPVDPSDARHRARVRRRPQGEDA